MFTGFEDIFIFGDLNGFTTWLFPFSATSLTFLSQDLQAALSNLIMFLVAAEFKLNIRIHFNPSAFLKQGPMKYEQVLC